MDLQNPEPERPLAPHFRATCLHGESGFFMLTVSKLVSQTNSFNLPLVLNRIPKTSGTTEGDSCLQRHLVEAFGWGCSTRHTGFDCRLHAQPATRLLMIFFLLNFESMLGSFHVMTQPFPISFDYCLSCPAQILRVELSRLVLTARENDWGWTWQAKVLLHGHLPDWWFGNDANSSTKFGRANDVTVVGLESRSRGKEETQQWLFRPYPITRCDHYCRQESQETLILQIFLKLSVLPRMVKISFLQQRWNLINPLTHPVSS